MAATLRLATLDDLFRIRNFARQVVGPYYASVGLGEFGEIQVREYWDSPGQEEAVRERRVLVAEIGAQFAGVAEFGELDDDAVLWKLYVAEQYRGTGLGGRLIDLTERHQPPDVTTLTLEHAAENVAAAGAYTALGFEVDRTEAGDDTTDQIVWCRRRIVREPGTIDHALHRSASGRTAETDSFFPNRWSAARTDDFIAETGSITIASVNDSGQPHAAYTIGGTFDRRPCFTVKPGTVLHRNLASEQRIGFSVSSEAGSAMGQGRAVRAATAPSESDAARIAPAGWTGEVWRIEVDRLVAG